jgi:GNAT superfamily N-acetyltransferase
MEIIALNGDSLRNALPDLAKLRIAVFREWPYLYDGTLEYEASYLEKFSAAKDAVIVAAKDGARIVGVATASPLLEHADAFAKPFADKNIDPATVYYFGESVLLPEYRGQGIGHAFFDAREEHARRSGNYKVASFCAVVRDAQDARKPANYRPLDAFWNKRGFQKAEGLVAKFDWQEVGDKKELPHQMQFWIKQL